MNQLEAIQILERYRKDIPLALATGETCLVNVPRTIWIDCIEVVGKKLKAKVSDGPITIEIVTDATEHELEAAKLYSDYQLGLKAFGVEKLYGVTV